MSLRRTTAFALFAATFLAGHAAQAQYYRPEGPPPPPYDEPYGRPPPPPYGRPYGYGRPPPVGVQCDARLPTSYGPRRLVCPLREPRGLGELCHCPPPPGYGYGPPLRGRVVP